MKPLQLFLFTTSLFSLLILVSIHSMTHCSLDLENTPEMTFNLQDPDRNSIEQNLYWICVNASTVEERTQLAEMGMSLNTITEDTAQGFIPHELINTVKKAGFAINSKVSIKQLSEQKVQKGKERFSFLNYGYVQRTLQHLADTHSDVASLLSIGNSVQSRKLWALRINTTQKGNQASKKPGVVFVGTIHAREHLATTVALELACKLCENKEKLRHLISQCDIYIIPLINPDGVEYDLAGPHYKYFRKNMRINPDKKIGVDLNRNFGYGWGGRGSSNITGSETYRGPFAFSEPETQALKQFLESKPTIKTFIAYHAYGELILYPWGNTSQPIDNLGDRKLHEQIAHEMSKITGYRPYQASKLYIASGDTTDWTYATHRIISFTIELFPKQFERINGSGFYPTDVKRIRETIANNIRAALYLINVSTNL